MNGVFRQIFQTYHNDEQPPEGIRSVLRRSSCFVRVEACHHRSYYHHRNRHRRDYSSCYGHHGYGYGYHGYGCSCYHHRGFVDHDDYHHRAEVIHTELASVSFL